MSAAPVSAFSIVPRKQEKQGRLRMAKTNPAKAASVKTKVQVAQPQPGELQPADYLAQLEALQIQRHLARFRSPAGAAQAIITHEATEFTHLCPFTGHPDFARIRISFRPLAWCVELKALKLYLQAYRDVRIPYEALLPILYGHLRDCLGFTEKTAKGRLRVDGNWNGRGGINSQVSIGAIAGDL
jgi:7-cyano-7-deazaguanine reductase